MDRWMGVWERAMKWPVCLERQIPTVYRAGLGWNWEGHGSNFWCLTASKQGRQTDSYFNHCQGGPSGLGRPFLNIYESLSVIYGVMLSIRRSHMNLVLGM